MGRSIEGAPVVGDDPMQVARIVFDLLRPVPIAPLTIQTNVVRPGRKVDLVESSISDDRGVAMKASAWRIRATKDLWTDAADLRAGAGVRHSPPPLPPPVETQLFDTGRASDYLHAMEWRFAEGEFLKPGPAATWLRMRHPLVEGEPPSPLSRVLIAADSASGISGALDYLEWIFINPDLAVHLHRMPVGEWVCLDAVTRPEPTGIGLAASIIYDEIGPIGRSSQSLYIAPR